MEYDKLKEEMNNRRLMPKKESWNKLETQLDQSASKPMIPFRFTVAASIVAILISTCITFLIYNGQRSLTPLAKQQKDPVAKPTQSKMQIPPYKIPKNFKAKDEKAYPLTVNVKNQTLAKSRNPTKEKQSPIVAKAKNMEQIKPTIQVTESTVKPNTKTDNENMVLALTPNKADNKNENIDKPKATVVKDELEELLTNAHAAIKNSQPKIIPTNTDPDALLREAEWDSRVKQETKLAGWINKNLKTFAKDKLSPKNASL